MKKIVNKIIQYFEIKIKEFNIFFMMRKTKNKIHFLVFCTPFHGNLGDHAITYAEETFFSDKFPNCVFIEISTDLIESKNFLKKLKKRVTEKDLLFINGGGFLGDLWLNEEYAVRKVLVTFKELTFIILPQTIFYQLPEETNRELKKSIEIINNKNIILCARDLRSYQFMKEHYTNTKVLFIPDMVLYLNKISRPYTRENVTFLFRKDKEKNIHNDEISELINEMKLNHEKIKFKDTVISKRVSLKSRAKELNRIWNEYYRSKLVITDRLHGMIFAAITGTPCIAFDNTSKKVSGVYEWIKNLKYIHLCNSYNEALDLYNEIINKRNIDNKFDLDLDFQELENIIKLKIHQGDEKNG